jgi:hypothetical protein
LGGGWFKRSFLAGPAFGLEAAEIGEAVVEDAVGEVAGAIIVRGTGLQTAGGVDDFGGEDGFEESYRGKFGNERFREGFGVSAWGCHGMRVHHGVKGFGCGFGIRL